MKLQYDFRLGWVLHKRKYELVNRHQFFLCPKNILASIMLRYDMEICNVTHQAMCLIMNREEKNWRCIVQFYI